MTEHGSVRDVRDVPIACRADVVVAGGGSAGVTAAIAAARMGARTVLLERNFCLGGMMTAGLMSSVGMSRLHGGIADEIMDALVRMGAAIRPGLPGDLPPSRRHGGGPIDPEQTKWLLDEMAAAAGVQVLLGSPVAAAVMDGTSIAMAIIESKSGRQAIRGTTFVDATGDGDLACRAGARYQVGRPEDGLCSASTLMFMVDNVDVGKVVAHFERNPGDYGSVFDGKATALSPWERLKEALSDSATVPAHFAFSASFVERIIASGQFTEWEQTVLTQRPMAFLTQPGATDRLLVNATRNPRIDATDGRALSDAVIEGRKQARFLHGVMTKHLPGFERSFISETAAQLGVRESRRITGEYVFTEQDLVGHAKFGDVIARNDAHIEVHNPGKGFSLVWPDRDRGQFYEIPYRSIVVKDLENCLLAGRCYSATHLALAGSRNIGLCMAMGEAAGRAAALAALGRIPVRQVPVGELQKLLGL